MIGRGPVPSMVSFVEAEHDDPGNLRGDRVEYPPPQEALGNVAQIPVVWVSLKEPRMLVVALVVPSSMPCGVPFPSRLVLVSRPCWLTNHWWRVVPTDLAFLLRESAPCEADS